MCVCVTDCASQSIFLTEGERERESVFCQLLDPPWWLIYSRIISRAQSSLTDEYALSACPISLSALWAGIIAVACFCHTCIISYHPHLILYLTITPDPKLHSTNLLLGDQSFNFIPPHQTSSPYLLYTTPAQMHSSSASKAAIPSNSNLVPRLIAHGRRQRSHAHKELSGRAPSDFYCNVFF